MNTLLSSITLLETTGVPEAKDVVAGWLGFAVFIGLGVAVALLCWSLSRQLRKTLRAKEAGVFGDVPQTGTQTGASTGTQSGTQVGQRTGPQDRDDDTFR